MARILAVTVAYEGDAPGDPQPTLIGLSELRQHCRAERVVALRPAASCLGPPRPDDTQARG